MRGPSLLFGVLCFFGVVTVGVNAGKAACHDPFFGKCYGILHTCPPACPRLCEVDCRLCKPYCGKNWILFACLPSLFMKIHE